MMQSETTVVRVNERVNEERYWRLLESIRGKKKSNEKDKKGRGSSANKGTYGKRDTVRPKR